MDKLPEVEDGFWDNNINKFNREITEEFLMQGHLSPHTLKQYKSGLRIFFKWVYDNCDNKSLIELKPRDALKYQNYLIGRGLSSSAIKFKRSSVSTLCGYIELYYSDEYPLFRNIYNKKIPNPGKAFVHEKKPLNTEEYNLLLDTLAARNEWQMLAWVKFIYTSGCRRSESVQLLKDVINSNLIVKEKVIGEEIIVKKYYLTHELRTKGRGIVGKVRKLQFSEDAMEAIKKWLDVRGEDDCLYVFVYKGSNGETRQLDVSTFNRWCTDIFSKIVNRRVHPHQFREQRATDLVVSEGKDIRAAQALLGHESPETTNIYVIRDTTDDVDDCF